MCSRRWTGILPPPNFISAENYCPKFILVEVDDKMLDKREEQSLEMFLTYYIYILQIDWSTIYKRQVINNKIQTNTVSSFLCPGGNPT